MIELLIAVSMLMVWGVNGVTLSFFMASLVAFGAWLCAGIEYLKEGNV